MTNDTPLQLGEWVQIIPAPPYWIFDPDMDVHTVMAIYDGLANLKGQHCGKSYTVPICVLGRVLSRKAGVELGLMEPNCALMVVNPKVNYMNMHVKEKEA